MRIRVLALAAVMAGALVTVSAQNAQRQVSLLVNGGIVVTVDAANRVIPNGAVAIDGTDIVAVDTAENIAKQFRGRETIDASGQIILPGLINTHTHAAMVLYRGLADDLALSEWLNKYIFPAEAKTVSPAFVRAGTRLAALEMIQSGTTTFTDMYYFEEEVAAETRAAGLRGVLGQTVIQFPVADAKAPAFLRNDRANTDAGDDRQWMALASVPAASTGRYSVARRAGADRSRHGRGRERRHRATGREGVRKSGEAARA